MFRLLGAREKEHRLFDGGHILIRGNEVVRVLLDWLDKYLGPTG